MEFHSTTFIIGLARAIGPLVKLHRHTGCAGALELALELADKATSEFFLPSGDMIVRRLAGIRIPQPASCLRSPSWPT